MRWHLIVSSPELICKIEGPDIKRVPSHITCLVHLPGWFGSFGLKWKRLIELWLTCFIYFKFYDSRCVILVGIQKLNLNITTKKTPNYYSISHLLKN